MFGDGSQTRSFCYVDDLVDGLMRMMNAPDDFSGPVNLGNPNEMTVLELAKLILELTGSKSRIVFEELPQDDPKVRCPDISLAKKALRWHPQISLKAGLAKTIPYFKKALLKEN